MDNNLEDADRELNHFLGLLNRDNLINSDYDVYESYISEENMKQSGEIESNGNLSVIYSCNESALSTNRMIKTPPKADQSIDLKRVLSNLDRAIYSKNFDLVKQAREQIIEYVNQFESQFTLFDSQQLESFTRLQASVKIKNKYIEEQDSQNTRLKELIIMANQQYEILDQKYQNAMLTLKEKEQSLQSLSARFLQTNTNLRDTVLELTSQRARKEQQRMKSASEYSDQYQSKKKQQTTLAPQIAKVIQSQFKNINPLQERDTNSNQRIVMDHNQQSTYRDLFLKSLKSVSSIKRS